MVLFKNVCKNKIYKKMKAELTSENFKQNFRVESLRFKSFNIETPPKKLFTRGNLSKGTSECSIFLSLIS